MMSWLPEDVSTFGREVDSLFYLIYYITGAVFILVMVAMIAFLVMYRQRQGRRAIYSHGNNTLEIIWTIVPAIIFIGLSFMSQATWAKIKSHAPPGDVELQVTGKQFNWEIVYPGPDKKFGTPDDLMAENELHVPAGKVVRVYLRSKDVIHSFYLPNLRLRQDVVPGREILAWFEATKPGKFELPCSQLCGFGHSGMKGWLYVHAAEDYAQWVKEKWPGS
jgi:cytochrome c oxidase subunit II